MADAVSVANFFRRKATEWSGQSGSLEQYIRNAGRKGLAEEFRSEPDFQSVCEFTRELGELQLRSSIEKTMEEYVSSLFGVPVIGLLDVVLFAVADACEFEALGDKLLKAAAGVFVTCLGALIVGALFSKSK